MSMAVHPMQDVPPSLCLDGTLWRKSPESGGRGGRCVAVCGRLGHFAERGGIGNVRDYCDLCKRILQLYRTMKTRGLTEFFVR